MSYHDSGSTNEWLYYLETVWFGDEEEEEQEEEEGAEGE